MAPYVRSGLALALLVSACAVEPDTSSVDQPVIFGSDGRLDYYETSTSDFGALLRGSTVALVEPAYIDISDPDNVVPDTITLGEYQDLCPGERYADQPSMASCSGTLIDDDLVLTAAHCVDATVCAEWYFVFGFYMTGPGELNQMTADDVYTCAEVLVHELTTDNNAATWHDYAIVRLDRPVHTSRTPAPVLMTPDTVRIGDDITALGFGDGIPGKVHGGASVFQATESFGYFVGSTDTFAGNSGSGTYNANHEIIGVFVRGIQSDYRPGGGGCYVANQVEETAASQEYDYAYKAVNDLCATGYQSARLCGGEPDPDPDPDPDPNPDPDPDPQPDPDPDPGAESSGCRGAPASPSPLGLALVVLVLGSLARRRVRAR